MDRLVVLAGSDSMTGFAVAAFCVLVVMFLIVSRKFW